jgi:hypoxanthine phosphoribosyltransferase
MVSAPLTAPLAAAGRADIMVFRAPVESLPLHPLGSPAVKILLDEAQIQAKVKELGRRIEADYQGKSLTIVAVLTGSLILLADLIRQIHLPLRVALLQASSYKGATTSASALIINESFAPDVTGRDVLLLDDIFDTGHTLTTLVHRMSDRGALSVRTAVLLLKSGRQEVGMRPDYFGFEIPNAFVVGYGLDFDDDYRHLPYVAVLDESTLPSTNDSSALP